MAIAGNQLGGTILGIHETTKSYDILFEDGSGEMDVDEGKVTLVESSGSSGDNVEKVGGAKKEKKNSSVGWNGGGFTGEDNVNTDIQPETSSSSSPLKPESNTISKPDKPSSSKSITHPKIGQSLEVKDFKSKSYRSAVITQIDIDLGSVDCKYEDGVEAKGVPITLLRDRSSGSNTKEKKEKKRKDKSSSRSSGDIPNANNTIGNDSDEKIAEINRVLAGFSTFEIDAALSMIKTIAKVSKLAKEKS